MYKKHLFFFILLNLFLANCWAEIRNTVSDDYFIPDYLKFDDIIYKKNIKTALIHPEGAPLTFPIITLNTDEKLKLSFDDLDADRKNYSYTVVHCDASWNPTNWFYTEYIDGFHDEIITEYKFSFNTIQSYTHYNLIFPTTSLRIKRSGNYIVKVFQDYEEQNIVLTKRFMVFDKKVEVNGVAKPASVIKDRYTKQEIDFSISNLEFDINEPYRDLKVTLLQNQRFDNAITNLKPTFTKPGHLVYEYDEGNVFIAGDEFRFYQNRNFRSANEKVAKYVFDENKKNNIYLLPEDKRTFRRYSTQQDINGKFLIQTLDGYEGETDADYAFIHFYLPADAALMSGNPYVFGAFSDWKLLPEFQMHYDSTFKAYTAAPYLKQGYFNYQFVVDDSEKKAIDFSTFEASHFETENDYYILVYYQVFGTYYDQLVGYKRINSRNR
jgi:hypothetical protein